MRWWSLLIKSLQDRQGELPSYLVYSVWSSTCKTVSYVHRRQLLEVTVGGGQDFLPPISLPSLPSLSAPLLSLASFPCCSFVPVPPCLFSFSPWLRDASELNNDGMIMLGNVHYQTEPNLSFFSEKDLINDNSSFCSHILLANDLQCDVFAVEKLLLNVRLCL